MKQAKKYKFADYADDEMNDNDDKIENDNGLVYDSKVDTVKGAKDTVTNINLNSKD